MRYIFENNKLVNIMNYIIRKLCKDDYKKGYIELLQEFSNYKKEISYKDFCKYLDQEIHTDIYIIIFKDQIIGAGTLFILNKLHSNNIGFIQDIIIKEEFRGKGLGKLLINKLIQESKEKNCYKIILNCNPDVSQFYQKIGFSKKGFEYDLRL